MKNKIRILMKNTVLELNMIVPIFLPRSKPPHQQSATYKSLENIKVQIYNFPKNLDLLLITSDFQI